MNFPLDSRQLRAFAVLSRKGSFTMAAKELFLSQSAVSHSMKALEQEVGCRLFDRVGKKVFLTQAGETLSHYAEKILGEMDTARASLKQLGQWGSSRIRIGASVMACQYLLPGVLREFKKSFPNCMVTIEPGDTPESIQRLHDNKIDLAIALEPQHENQIEFHPLFTDELSFLLGPTHPWAQAGRVIREEIPKQSYILYSKSSYTFRAVSEYFRKEDMALNSIIELGSMEAIKELVKLELGVGVASPWIAKQELEDKSLFSLRLGKRKLKRTWGVFHLKGRPLGLSEETFLNQCRTVTDSLARDGYQLMAA